jgi:putative Holliday junction resolvase
MVREHDVAVVVVGHPLTMAGEARTRARHAEELAGALRGFLEIPVQLQDERLSTAEAERSLRDAGVKGRSRRAVVDQTAATVILQAWLDAHAEPAAEPSNG